jgi:hypothetical protein
MQAVANNSNNAGSSGSSSNNASHSTYFVYPLFNFVSAGMFGKFEMDTRISRWSIFILSGSTGASNPAMINTNRHYLICSYFVSPYQTVRSLAEELSSKFGKPLEEMRIWLRHSEVRIDKWSTEAWGILVADLEWSSPNRFRIDR